MISEGLRQEVKPCNIRTTVISPGAVTMNSSTTSPSRMSPPRRKTYEQAISAGSFAAKGYSPSPSPSDVDVNEILFRRRRRSFRWAAASA